MVDLAAQWLDTGIQRDTKDTVRYRGRMQVKYRREFPKIRARGGLNSARL